MISKFWTLDVASLALSVEVRKDMGAADRVKNWFSLRCPIRDSSGNELVGGNEARFQGQVKMDLNLGVTG